MSHAREKEVKRTVGITLLPCLMAEARKRSLDISRISEQALQSIIEYIPQENHSESSKYLLSEALFRKKVCGVALAW